MKKLLAVVLLLLSFNAHANKPTGKANPAVTQSNIQTTICVPGWTKTVRPSTHYTNNIKVQRLRDEHLPGTISDYELDHLISLQLGGHPTDVRNLWMQPLKGSSGALVKDKLETALKRDVCSGKITLSYARRAISNNWIKEYNKRYPDTPIK